MKEIRELEKSDKKAFLQFNTALWEEKNEGNTFFTPKKVTDFETYFKKLQEDKLAKKDENWSAVTHYFYFKDGKIIAKISCRWELVGNLSTNGGQIGYIVDRDYRNQGIMTELLGFALVKFFKKGHKSVYITTALDNLASQKVIEKHGGVLEKEMHNSGHVIKGYRIDLESYFSKPALIWDLDGTLIDSYEAIGEALEVLYKNFAISFEKESTLDFVKRESVGKLLGKLSHQYNIPLPKLNQCFVKEQEKRDDQITLLPFAKEILELTSLLGVRHFMYTHKGKTTEEVLRKFGIRSYFTEVLTSISGFKRKPEPEAILYLIHKYKLNPENTYYVGDRKLDLEVAQKAHIGSFNLTQEDSPSNTFINDLLEIKDKLTF